jgi:competence protein ComEC
MHRHPAPRRPALPVALAVLAGAALGEALAPGVTLRLCSPSIGCLAALAAWRCRRRLRFWALLVAVSALACWLAIEGRWRQDSDLSGRLPDDGRSVEAELVGSVLAAPEKALRGERVLRVRARFVPEDEFSRSSPDRPRELDCLLRIRASSALATERVDNLRRGDEIRCWGRMRQPAPPGNPHSPRPGDALRARGIDVAGSVKNAWLVERLHVGRGTPGRRLDQLKSWMRRRLDRTMPPGERCRPVLGAMLLGDRAALPPEIVNKLRDAGLVHLIAISGLHTGMLVLVAFAFLRRLARRPVAIVSVGALMLVSFAALVGPRPPILRATAAAIVAAVGRACHRDGNPINTLAVVAAGLAIWNSALVLDPGYQLTFLATAGIAAMTRPVARRIPLPRSIAIPLGVTVSAYLATAPSVAWHFGRLAPVALGTNLLAAPLCAWILAAGATVICLGDLPWLGAWAARAAHLAVESLLGVAEWGSGLPGGSMVVARPSPLLVASYYLFLAHAIVRARDGTRGSSPWWRAAPRAVETRLTCLLLAVLLGALHLGPIPPSTGEEFELVVPYVGQAQAVVVRGSSGGFVVVDAGGTAGGRFDSGARIVGPILARLGCRRIDVLILTHDHDDHAGGARSLLNDFEVGELWVGPWAHSSARSRALTRTAREEGVAVVLAERGLRLRRAGLRMHVLHPERRDGALDDNNRSVVVRVEGKRFGVLIPGDLESPGERSLVRRSGSEIRSAVLLMGHHGAARSSSERFLDAVRPEVAIVSAGRWNRFGHPRDQVLKRLLDRGVRIARTDRHGMIRLRATSTCLRLATHRGSVPRGSRAGEQADRPPRR